MSTGFLIDFGGTDSIWIPAWHPCVPLVDPKDEFEQRGFFRSVVAQIPYYQLQVLIDEGTMELIEREQNQSLGLGLTSEHQWKRIIVPPCGDSLNN